MKFFSNSLPALALVFLTGCGKENQATRITFEAHEISGSVHVTPGAAAALPLQAASISNFLSRTMKSLDSENIESDLARINRAGSSSRLPTSPNTFRLIDLCRHYNAITDDAFDVTTGNIAALWKKGIPSIRNLNNAMGLSGMEYVGTAENGSAILIKPGVEITPGRTLGAYAIDLSIINFRHRFGGPMLIELGMHARSFGKFTTNNTPRLPIRIPEQLNDKVVGHILFTTEKAVANYTLPHRESLPKKLRTEFLIDTRTGYPALGTKHVVVTGPLTIKAHALAEALLVLGKERGQEILKHFDGYEIMLVPDRKPLEIWMTPGFKRQFDPTEMISLLIKDWEIEAD